MLVLTGKSRGFLLHWLARKKSLPCLGEGPGVNEAGWSPLGMEASWSTEAEGLRGLL